MQKMSFKKLSPDVLLHIPLSSLVLPSFDEVVLEHKQSNNVRCAKLISNIQYTFRLKKKKHA